MNNMNGNLNITSLPEILRLCAVQQKTGTLTLTHADVNKKLYFSKGTLIFITSNKNGERVGEFLIQRGDLTRTWAGFLLKDSQRNGIAFTSNLLKNNIIEKTRLELALSELANAALADAMSWTNGHYEFSDNLPQQALEGPIRISEARALHHVLQQGKVPAAPNEADDILRNVARKIAGGNFSLPLPPRVITRINECWDHGSPDTLADQVLKLVRCDQVLSSYLLRVVNSSIGSHTERYITVQQAIAHHPAAHLLGIVHAQAACALSPKQVDIVSQLLRRALRCACMAELIAARLAEDSELAFTCGLFHNIGKVLLLQLLADEAISEAMVSMLVEKFHQNAGSLLSRRWNLAPVITDCIRGYDNPQQIKENRVMVEIVHLSHALLQPLLQHQELFQHCTTLDIKHLNIDELLNNMDLIDETVASIY